MPRATQPVDPLPVALTETARALERLAPGRPPGALRDQACLALLRRQELERAWPGLPLAEAWARARAAGCPLLAPDLDAAPEEAREACGLAGVPPGQEPGGLHQGLQEWKLARQGGQLVARRAREARRQRGAFYTPGWMAARLAELLWPESTPAPGSLLDPACGDGRLLLAVAERLRVGAPPADRARALRDRLGVSWFGVERDPWAAALARTALWRLCDPTRGPVEGLARAVRVADALTGPARPGLGATSPADALDWPRAFPELLGAGRPGFQAIVANPPFEVLTGFQREPARQGYTAALRAAGFQLALGGVLNTYRLFLERCLELLAPGGRLAIVLPVGFLMDRAAAPLRAYLLRQGWIEEAAHYPESARAFEGVGQGVVLLGVRRQARADGVVRVVDGPSGRVERQEVAHLLALDPESPPLPLEGAAGVGLAARLRAQNGGSLEEVAEGRVGEVDQTVFRAHMRSQPGGALLVRGAHLSPYRVELGLVDPRERWLDPEGFANQKGGGSWREELARPRVAQTGIVNLEAARRLVAAEVPAGVYLGNSVNSWSPRPREGFPEGEQRAYLLGLLNSAPLEWRFRLTSSNHNVNLYEIRALPLPRIRSALGPEAEEDWLERQARLIAASGSSPLGTVHQVTGGWGRPERNDRAVARLLGRVARLREAERGSERQAWLDGVLDHLTAWHLGLEESDLARMLERLPARAREVRREEAKASVRGRRKRKTPRVE
jgi:SAM-dependent methyltransferase